MDALEVLHNEHGLIRQYLDNLALASEKLEQGQPPPRAFFDRAIEFSRQFVDKHHHFKEEHVMFTWLAQKKGGAFDGPIDSLRYQHERSRNHISSIAEALSGYDEGRDDKVTTVIENLAAYISTLRHHIHREDHVLYPMVREELERSEHQELTAAFEDATRRADEGVVEKSQELVMSMGSILESSSPV